MSLLHDQELADTIEAERLRRERSLDEQLLDRAARAAVAAAEAERLRPVVVERSLSSSRGRAIVDAAAARLALALEAEETPPELRREQLAGVLRTLRDLGVFRRRQLEGGPA